MKTFIILRRSYWRSATELGEAAARSTKTGDAMGDDIRWIRSYVLDDARETLGTVCVYQATSAEAIRVHAAKAVLPVDEIIEVQDLVVVRPDPEALSAK